MFLRIGSGLSIDNLNGYTAEIVAQLEGLLTSGAIARPDPKRRNFYDVENSGRVFFIHAAPGSGKVILLATWPAALPLAEAVIGAANVRASHGSLAALVEPSNA